jgi:hypothetical protein
MTASTFLDAERALVPVVLPGEWVEQAACARAVEAGEARRR